MNFNLKDNPQNRDINVKLKTIIPLEDNMENLDVIKLGKDVLDDTKTWSMKEKINKLDFNKSKNIYPFKTLWREWKDKLHTEIKYLQIISEKRLASRM